MSPPKTIPFNKPFFVGNELDYIARAVQAEHLSGDGPFTQKCQQWLEKKLGCHKALLTHSCTAALEMAAILFNIKAGDEVIMPSFTFVSTANAFVLRGAVPVFIDIREDTLNADARLIERAITTRTKAVVPVHYAGNPCEMNEIITVAAKHGLRVIEDAAQGLMSSYRNRFLGTIGHAGCLSFHETKNVTCGEGGALLLNDESLIERAEILWEKGTDRKKFSRGQVDKYTWVDIGSSFLPGELTAAFLYAQLEHAEKILSVRKRIFKRYMQGLRPLADEGFIQLPGTQKECVCNGHIFYILAKDLKERTRLTSHLCAQGIHAIFHYVPLHSSPAGKRYGRTGSKMSVTDDVSDRVLRLPFYYELTENDVDKVVRAIGSYFQQ